MAKCEGKKKRQKRDTGYLECEKKREKQVNDEKRYSRHVKGKDGGRRRDPTLVRTSPKKLSVR